MSQEGTFQKVESSNKKMYGQKGLLVCGYPEPEQLALLSLLKENKLSAFPVIFVTNGDMQTTLKQIFVAEDRHGQGETSEMTRASIMSGFTQEELHILMESHKSSDLPTQLWAALTPTSENWSVIDLLNELSSEHEAVKKQRK